MINEEDFFWANGVERIASKVVWKRFHINTEELNMLCCLHTVLSLKGRRAIAERAVVEWIGAGFVLKKRIKIYFGGLILKGCVHKLNYRQRRHGPGNSLAITDFGARVLECFYEEIKKLEAKRPARYQTLAETKVNANRVSELLPQYILVKAGRDD